eukprot:m.161903 g.161903  ORF g.161903 m.161903 type:complete len:98 (-) comp14367_c7_seq1:300-593(-)
MPMQAFALTFSSNWWVLGFFLVSLPELILFYFFKKVQERVAFTKLCIFVRVWQLSFCLLVFYYMFLFVKKLHKMKQKLGSWCVTRLWCCTLLEQFPL